MREGPLKAIPRCVVGVLIATLAMAGCSEGDEAALSSPSTTSRRAATSVPVTTTVAPAPTTIRDADPCPSSALALAVGEGRSALGRGLYVFEVRNTSAAACRLLGYPAATVVDGQGGVLANAQPGGGRLLADRAPAAVLVASGGAAYVGLESATVCNDGARPSASRRVHITPPNWVESTLTVAATVTVCPGQVVHVSPIRASETELTQ